MDMYMGTVVETLALAAVGKICVLESDESSNPDSINF